MTLLDAYGLVALLAREPAAEEVAELLRDDVCVIPAANLAEAVDVICRVHGVPLVEVREVVGSLTTDGGLGVQSLGEAEAWRAAALRGRYYVRRACEVSLADCFLVASARPGDAVATADPALAAVARAEGIDVVALPGSSAARP